MNLTNIFAIIFLMILMILSFFYKNELKDAIRDFLELPGLYWVLSGTTFIIFFIAYFNNTESSNKVSFIGSSFGRFFDTIINGLTYAAAISSSLTLIKGFYIQKFFEDKKYFLEFSSIDVWLLFLTMCFLFYFSLERVISNIKELIWTNESKEVD